MIVLSSSAAAPAQHLDAHGDHAFPDHVDLPRGGFGEVDDASPARGASVIDADVDGLSIVEVLYPDDGAKRVLSVSGGEVVFVEDFSGRGGPPVILIAVPGGLALLRLFAVTPGRQAAPGEAPKEKEHDDCRAPRLYAKGPCPIRADPGFMFSVEHSLATR